MLPQCCSTVSLRLNLVIMLSIAMVSTLASAAYSQPAHATLVINIDDTKNYEYEGIVWTVHLEVNAQALVGFGGTEEYSGSAVAATSVQGAFQEITIYQPSSNDSGTVDFVLRPNISCKYEIEPIGSQTDHTCWAAGLEMMMSWRDNKTYPIQEAVDKAGPEMRMKLDRDDPVVDEDFDTLLTPVGMTTEPATGYDIPSEWTVRDIQGMLEQYGPLMILRGPGDAELSTDVIKAIEGDGTPEGTRITYNAAAVGLEYSGSAGDFLPSINNSTNWMMKISHFKEKAKSPCPGIKYQGDGHLRLQALAPRETVMTAPNASATIEEDQKAVTGVVTTEDGTTTVQLPAQAGGVEMPIAVSVQGGLATVTVYMDPVPLTFEGTAKVLQSD